MQLDIIDYRNGKYQGSINPAKQRHGLGIFIDDDLTFHISHWLNNKLNGQTLVYLAHGKYMYGQWKLNQPHGLNIYRSGDTVLLARYRQGVPSERCLLIFEKYNFACVLSENGKQWKIVQSGPLPNHKVLLKYIEQIGLPVPEHYFSLTKFACNFSNNNGQIKTFPCITNHCYFGFINGLGIIFNSNNGVVSVGHHRNQEICQFGARYDGTRKIQEGNFQSDGEVVSYLGQRPATKIHNIFQKLHKRGLNFYNQYFQSKLKLFNNIETLLRDKMQDIAEECRKQQQFKNINLNDSLDYQEYNEQESFKMNENREKMYSPPKKIMQKSQSKLNINSRNSQKLQSSTNSKSKFNNNDCYQQQKLISQQPRDFNQKNTQYNKQKSPFKNQKLQLTKTQQQQRYNPYVNKLSRYHQNNQNMIRQKLKANNLRYINLTHAQNTLQKETHISQFRKEGRREKSEQITFSNISITFNKKPYLQKNSDYNDVIYENTKQQENQYKKIPTFKGILEQKNKRHEQLGYSNLQNLQETSKFKKTQLSNINSTPKQFFQDDQSEKKAYSPAPKRSKKQVQIKRPNYQEIQQRRKRILQQFKQLNHEQQNHKRSINSHESPVKSNDMVISSNHSRQSSFGYIPLSISNKVNENNKKTLRNGDQNKQQIKNIGSFSKKNISQKSLNASPSTPLRHRAKINNSIHEQQASPSMKTNFNNPNPNQLSAYPEQQQPKRRQNISPSASTTSQSNLTPGRQKRTYQYLFE